jgi:hypothetical protein
MQHQQHQLQEHQMFSERATSTKPPKRNLPLLETVESADIEAHMTANLCFPCQACPMIQVTKAEGHP